MTQGTQARQPAYPWRGRITVTPGHVEVMALTTDGDDDIAGFLDRKRQWLFNTMRDMLQARLPAATDAATGTTGTTSSN